MSDVRRVVLDVDVGIDDALMILYLLSEPQVEIVAIGATHGNCTAADSARNALRTLEAVGVTSVPVALGLESPFAVPKSSPLVHGHDGLGDIDLPLPAGSVSVTIVLLKVALIKPLPRGMFLRSRRRIRVLPPRAAPPDRRRSDIIVVSPLPVRSQNQPCPPGGQRITSCCEYRCRASDHAGCGHWCGCADRERACHGGGADRDSTRYPSGA